MNYMRNQQEIHEAINAADDALSALRRAEKSLSDAGGWGLWDMLGGGFFSTFMKHDRMDQARHALEEARGALSRLCKELGDLDRVVDFDLNIGDFLHFADYLFDGLVADVMVQSKIRQGQRQVEKAIRQVEDVRQRLWSMLR